MIEFVSATRLSKKAFWERSALGQSLRRLAHNPRLSAFVAFENLRALSDVYNARIVSPKSPEILVFVHDDVWLDDYFIAERLVEALASYDVVGVAGNKRRVHKQPAWIFVDDTFQRDHGANMSGSIAHGGPPFGAVSYFGPSPAECELLDGVFIAAKKEVLIGQKLQFDPQFDFNFYDMDFCRSARQKNLRVGTWPICLTHQSVGAFGSEKWREKYRLYLKKWDEAAVGIKA